MNKKRNNIGVFQREIGYHYEYLIIDDGEVVIAGNGAIQHDIKDANTPDWKQVKVILHDFLKYEGVEVFGKICELLHSSNSYEIAKEIIMEEQRKLEKLKKQHNM